MKIRFLLLFLIAGFHVFFTGCYNSQKAIDIHLIRSFTDIPGITQDEINKINELQKVYKSLTYGKMYGTESFINDDGSFSGFSVKFCELLSMLFGIEFNLELFEFDELYEGVFNKTIDFTGELTPTPERSHFLHMTYPITERTQKFFVLSDKEHITAEKDIYGFRVGYLRNSVDAGLIQIYYPNLNLNFIPVNNISAAVNMLKNGDIDAFATESVLEPAINSHDSILSIDFFPLVYTPVAVSTAKDDLKVIITVLNKYFSAGGLEFVYELFKQGNEEYARHRLSQYFSDDEKAYLHYLENTGSTVKIALDAEDYPVSFYNSSEKQFNGIAIDVLNEIGKLTGIVFEIANDETTTWPQTYERLISGEISLVSELLITNEREGKFLWADMPYASSYYALISKEDFPNLLMYQVARTKVGAIEETANIDKYNEWFAENNNLVIYPDHKAVFEAIDRGEIDLFMGSENRLLMQHNFYEKPGYKINIRFNTPMESYFGLNINEVHLRSIISKAQNFVNTEIIENNWKSKGYNYARIIEQQKVRYLFISVILISILLAILFILFIKYRKMYCNLDIIVKNRTKELELKTEAAKVASRSKTAFLAKMSHEIRTPMNSIIGFTELAMDGTLPQKTREYLLKISESAEWLLSIINDILDISKIETGKLELEIVPFELNDILDHCRSVILPKTTEKGISLFCHMEKPIEKKLLGDPIRLRQALINLLSNAAKFTNTGSIKLYASAKEVNDNNITINFEVKDSGIGMTQDQVDKIFDPFIQADDSITRKFGGAGLGLTITRNIIEMMGGKLSVESGVGVGSKFSFTLNFKVINDTELKKEENIIISELERPDFKGDVLVAEDNLMNQQVIIEHLEKVGIKPVIAENGKEGLDIVKERIKQGIKQFDLILMDIHMPIMDGLEAAGKIKELGITTPIIAMTANIMSNDLELYKQYGMYDALGKPFKTQELYKYLVKYLEVVSINKIDNVTKAADEEKMMRHLKINFLKSNRNTFEEIRNAVYNADKKLAHRLAHTLKSNAGQIGEKKLQEIAAHIESILKSDVNGLRENHYKNLSNELNYVLEKLEPLLDEDNAKKKNIRLPPKKIIELMDNLETMLNNKNPQCMNLLDEIKTIDGTEELISHIEDFEFKKALEELYNLKEKGVFNV